MSNLHNNSSLNLWQANRDVANVQWRGNAKNVPEAIAGLTIDEEPEIVRDRHPEVRPDEAQQRNEGE